MARGDLDTLRKNSLASKISKEGKFWKVFRTLEFTFPQSKIEENTPTAVQPVQRIERLTFSYVVGQIWPTDLFPLNM